MKKGLKFVLSLSRSSEGVVRAGVTVDRRNAICTSLENSVRVLDLET